MLLSQTKQGTRLDRRLEFLLRKCGKAGRMNEKLKNCPFCGDTYIKIYHSRAGYQVGCNTVNCIACHGYVRAYKTEKEAVDAWNRRACDE